MPMLCFQNEAAAKVNEKHQKELAVLKGLDLAQYAIKGSDKDWSNSLSGTTPKTLVSMKR